MSMGTKTGAMRLPDCPTCNLAFYGRQNRLTCSECNVVVHAKCGGADTAEKFEAIVESYKCKDQTECVLRKSMREFDNSQLSCKTPNNKGLGVTTPTLERTDLEPTSLCGTVDLILVELKTLKTTLSKVVSENMSMKREIQNLTQVLKRTVSVSSNLSNHQVMQVPTTSVATASPNLTSNKVVNTQSKVSNGKQSNDKQNNGHKQTYSNAVSEATKFQSTGDSISSSQAADADGESGFTLVQSRRKNRTGSGGPGAAGPIKEGPGSKAVPYNKPTGNGSYAPSGSQQSSRRPASIGASISSSLKSIAPFKRVRTRSLFVTRFDPTVTDSTIEDHLKSNLGILKRVKATRLSTRHDTYTSFHVEVSEEDFSFVNNPSIWPEGILFKEYLGRLRPDKVYGQQVKPQKNSNHPNTVNSDNGVNTVNFNNDSFGIVGTVGSSSVVLGTATNNNMSDDPNNQTT